jgi:hypothetical protein
MKPCDLFTQLQRPAKEKPKIIIANRAPTSMDKPSAQWWYDRSEKVMYRATQHEYIKD